MGITVLTTVYNEERRIARFVSSFSVFSEIIIVDKSSTDRTREIAEAAGARVVTIPYTDAGDTSEFGRQLATNDWLLIVTASDVVHRDLPNVLYEAIEKFGHSNKCFHVPYIIYALGISGDFSVFDSKYRPCLAHKEYMEFRDRVHEELVFHDANPRYLKYDSWVAIHHLTHETIESSLERVIRYSRSEVSKVSNGRLSSKKQFWRIIRTILGWGRRRGWKGRWDSVGLLILQLVYEMIVFLRFYFEGEKNGIALRYEDLSTRLRQGELPNK